MADNYIVKSEELKQIAEAIREKTGTSDSLEFPTAMAEAIAAIEAGGFDLSAIQLSKVACGTFTPSSTTNKVNVTHGLESIPKIICVYSEDVTSVVNSSVAAILSIFSLLMTDSTGETWNAKHVTGKGNASWGKTLSTIERILAKGSHLTVSSNYTTLGISAVDETSCTLNTHLSGGGFDVQFLPITYKWFALA